MRPNKLECLSLETLSSQVIEFEGKARVNSMGVPFRVLPANDRLYWKVIANYEHSSLFGVVISIKGKKFYNIHTWGHIFSRVWPIYEWAVNDLDP